MSDSGVGFGGFLLGVGGGYYLFRYVDFSFDIIGYLLILMGIGIILGHYLSQGRKHPMKDIWGGFIGGLFLAVFLTQGFGLIGDITNQWTDFDDNTYRATRDVSLNQVIEATSVNLSVDSVNGAIDVSPWSGDDVKIDLEIKAKGSSTADAEDNLDDFRYELSSEQSGGIQDITLTFPLSSMNLWSTYSVYVQVFVPETQIDEIDLATNNGAISIEDLELSGLYVDTTNGAISFSDVSATDLLAHTTNGAIAGTITSTTGSYSTTNGAIDITVGANSGSYNLDTTNGSIEVNLPSGSDIGYKINLDTSIGSLDVNLPSINYSVDRTREKVGQTDDYESKTVQIEIDADTSIGGIELN
jgi:DUF4097 and DUF4098 domain-containing protein YvlB